MAEHTLMDDAQWAKMVADRNAIFDQITAKLEALLQLHNVSLSSFHGAANSCKEIPAWESLNVVVPSASEIPDSDSMTAALPSLDAFLPSTEQIPLASEKNSSVEMDHIVLCQQLDTEIQQTDVVKPTRDLDAEFMDLSKPTTSMTINTMESLSISKIVVECHFRLDCARKSEVILPTLGKVKFELEKPIKSQTPDLKLMRLSSALDQLPPKPPDLSCFMVALTLRPPMKPPDRGHCSGNNEKRVATMVTVEYGRWFKFDGVVTGDSPMLLPPPEPPDSKVLMECAMPHCKVCMATGTMSHNYVNCFLRLSCLSQFGAYYLLRNAAVSEIVEVPKWAFIEMLNHLSNCAPVLHDNSVPIYIIFPVKLGGVLIHGLVHTPGFINCVDEHMNPRELYSKVDNMRTAQQVFDERAHLIVVFGYVLRKVETARCLMKFQEKLDSAWVVSAHGGFTALLSNIVGVEEIKRQMVIREGEICALLCVLDPKWPYASKTMEITKRAIESSCFSSSSSLSILMGYDFVDHLLYCVRNLGFSIQELVLYVALRWCITSEEAKKVLGDVGFMQALVKFQSAKSFEVCEMAAEALSGMVMVPRNRNRFMQDYHIIALLLQLLDPAEEKSEVVVSFDAKALMDGNLTIDNNPCSSDGVTEVELFMPFLNDSFVQACSQIYVFGILSFRGLICPIAYLNSKEPISQAIIVIKGDISTSLQSILNIICDEVQGNLGSNHDVRKEVSEDMPQVPYYFIFGDSLVDKGNDKVLQYWAKENESTEEASKFLQYLTWHERVLLDIYLCQRDEAAFLIYNQQPVSIFRTNTIIQGSLLVPPLFNHWENLDKSGTTWKNATIIFQHCLNLNLEDKVGFKGEGNVMRLGQLSKKLVTKGEVYKRENSNWRGYALSDVMNFFF